MSLLITDSAPLGAPSRGHRLTLHAANPHARPLLPAPQVSPWKFTGAELQAAVTRLLGDAATQRRAAAVGVELRRETGAATAARLILQFVQDTVEAGAEAAVPAPGTPPPSCPRAVQGM